MYHSLKHSLLKHFNRAATRMNPCIQNICEKYEGKRIIDGFDIVLVPDLLRKLGEEISLLDKLVQKYPIRSADDEIVPESVQWVAGENKALMYRGNVLKREKIWLQRGSVRDGFAYYYYTGVQWEVVPAQTDWVQCPEFLGLVNEYDNFCDAIGAQKANQAIITRYRNGNHFIGKHYDKPKSIESSKEGAASLITVLKIGPVGRRFNLYDLQENLIWSQIIKPGDALIMTLESNLNTKHEVPICASDEAVGDSGSIVFRSISSVLPYDKVWKNVAQSRRVKERAHAAKRAREGE